MDAQNEKIIRDEIKRLDGITKLSGSEVPIVFSSRATSTLGCFNVDKDGNMSFSFSDSYYMDSKFPIQEKIDTIRHEYAHYMCYMLYGPYHGHDKFWKRCCTEIGATPTRLYNASRAEYYNEKNKKENDLICKVNAYKVGDKVAHPNFGQGTIISITGEAKSTFAIVKFANDMEKNISLYWLAGQ